MTALETALLASLQALAPVTNVFAPDPADHTTWQVGFADMATAQQRAAAAQALAAFTMPAALPDISDRQCFQQLAVQGLITQDEALQAVTVGALPQAVTNGIAALPAAQQFGAKMLLCGATAFHRAHPMVPAFMAMVGISAPADIDAFWTAAALL